MRDSYKVPFYILGFLIRLGPLHGYHLKMHLEHEASDFARIKLPTIYYHLGVMKGKGWVVSDVGKEGNRPEKQVFSITEDGKRKFRELLNRCLMEPVTFDFPVDGALFFSKGFSAARIAKRLADRKKQAGVILKHLSLHRDEVLHEVPVAFGDVAALLLAHHELHYQAEQKWLQSAIEVFGGRS
ncbi:MAG TPA: PadR family transcriptional regulator [Spirochaetia bacterium]|nr:PadR family transcriptional regulator [Spirochaetia bacterium]